MIKLILSKDRYLFPNVANAKSYHAEHLLSDFLFFIPPLKFKYKLLKYLVRILSTYEGKHVHNRFIEH